jgi:predicted AAA+ superfamily ATPase
LDRTLIWNQRHLLYSLREFEHFYNEHRPTGLSELPHRCARYPDRLPILLEAVFLTYRLPAWGTTLGSRVTKHPKVHLVDSGVMAWLLNLAPHKIAQAAPATLTEYGHLLETFAVGEMLKQASWSDAPVTAGHFRTESGDEADLVLERDDGQVIAVEIKAGSRISGEDFRGPRQLKERLGPRLEEAIILHTGEHAYTHEDWITVLPLDRLWA